MTESESNNSYSERRDGDRTHVHADVGIDAQDRADRVGITRNISNKGALFHSASKFRPGETLSLAFRDPSEDVEHSVKARVVRTDLDDQDGGNIFRHLTAVEFEEPIGH